MTVVDADRNTWPEEDPGGDRPPRIALVIPSFVGGGAERVFVDLAGGLRERSIEVDMVVVSGEGPLRSAVPEGVGTVVLGGGNVLAALPRLVAYLRRERPAAVWSCLNHMNLVSILACRLVRPRVRVMVTVQNTLSVKVANAPSWRDRSMPVLMRLGLPFADRVLAVSHGVADDLAATTGLSRSMIHVAHNPVAFPRLAEAAAEPVDHPWLEAGAGPVLLGVGRLNPQKDFGLLIRALALLPEDHRLILLGEGEQRAELSQLVERLGVADRVDLHGFVENPYPYFRRADVFVLSSGWEGLPTVLIEAVATGIRIVATDIKSGPREILAGGRWGRLVPPGDPEVLARAVVEALDDEVVDRSEACTPYTLDNVTDRYLELLGMDVAGLSKPG